MKTEKKEDQKEHISLIQHPYEVKGPRVYDQYSTIKPTKYYYCSTCGEIKAVDVIKKDTDDEMQKPFCKKCENPVFLVN